MYYAVYTVSIIVIFAICIVVGTFVFWGLGNSLVSDIHSHVENELVLRQDLLGKVVSGHFGIYDKPQLLFLATAFYRDFSPEYLITLVDINIVEIEMVYYHLSYLSVEDMQRLLKVLSLSM